MFNKPTLIVDEKICRKNILKMVEKASLHKLEFRPHFKTHQSKKIGNWFKDYGVEKITVSSVNMAEYFIASGWTDLSIAFPFNIREINKINNIAKQINLNLLAESEETIEYLHNNLKRHCGIFIKIDTGYHRTGIEYDQADKIDCLVSLIEKSQKLNFKGFLTHSGNTYQARSKNEILSIFKKTKLELLNLKKRYQNTNPDIILSVGDTPSTSIVEDFTGIDEIRPGNFVFYDAEQYQLGSCDFEDIAVTMACPVVAIHKVRNEFVIYGGAVHLSKDYTISNNVKNYGLVCLHNGKRLEQPLRGTYVKSLSQEHGIISTQKEVLENIKIGDMIHIIPSHICLTANLSGRYYTLDGKILDHLSGSSY